MTRQELHVVDCLTSLNLNSKHMVTKACHSLVSYSKDYENQEH